MENNIFEGAKFGNKFVTRDGRVAIYMLNKDGLYLLVPEDYYSFIAYRSNGREIEDEEHGIDIISRYQEPIDEDKLDELAENYSIDEWGYTDKVVMKYFKSGYRKAMEE